MNRLLLSTLAAGTLLAGGAAALAQSSNTAPPPPEPRNAFFDEMDSNHDGVVTRAEMTAVVEQRFAALDTDHDGKISAAERQAERDHRRVERFSAMDTDHNGQLSQQELEAARTARAEDGQDGRGPRGRGFGGGRGFGRGGDSAGDIAKADFMAPALTRFDLLDSNDDGKITAEERDAAMARFHRGPRGHNPTA